MEERRKLERFELKAPTTVRVPLDGGRLQKFDLVTRDVSSAGAFVFSPQQIPEGTRVRIEFFIPLDTLKNVVGEQGRARVRVKGKVVRVDEDGVAICFDSRYNITAFESYDH